MSPTAGLSFSEGGKAVATIINIFDIQPVDCRVMARRAGEGLDTISRIGIDATFRVAFVSVLASTMKVYFQITPGNFAQLLIIHILIAGFFHF